MAIASLNYITTFVTTVRVLASLGGIKEKFQGHNLDLDDVTKQAINKLLMCCYRNQKQANLFKTVNVFCEIRML